MDGETVWLSQAQMAELFGTKRQAITKHLQNIYDCEELNREATSSKMELVRKEGNRAVKRCRSYMRKVNYPQASSSLASIPRARRFLAPLAPTGERTS